jgi:glycine cleavage system aminomethyltransferase T
MASIVTKDEQPQLETAVIGAQEVVWEFGDYAAEYGAVRGGAALIDQSAGGPIRVRGAGAQATLQRALARDVEFLAPERARMSLVLGADGAVIDVVTVVAGEGDYHVLTGPGQAARVEAALRDAAADGTQVDNLEAELAVLAIEGPDAGRVVASVLGSEYASLAYESSLPVELDGADALVARVGVTGEYGYTFLVPVTAAAALWRALVAAGAVPAGHRARETAMFELRQPIVHREVGPGDTVVSAGLGWLLDPVKEDFVGRDAALAGADDPDALRPIGFRADGAAPDAGDALFVGPEEVGHVVFVVDSPGAGATLGLAKVAREWQASRLEFATAGGDAVRTLAPPYVVPKSWGAPITG